MRRDSKGGGFIHRMCRHDGKFRILADAFPHRRRERAADLGSMIQPEDVLLTLAISAVVVETFLLRRDLEEHGLHLWIYAGIPVLSLGAMFLVFWDQMPYEVADTMFATLSAISMAVMFIGMMIAYRKRRTGP